MKQYGIEYFQLDTYPVEYVEEDCNSFMHKMIGRWKAKFINDTGIDTCIDDNSDYIKQIKKTNPDLLILQPWLKSENSCLVLRDVS